MSEGKCSRRFSTLGLALLLSACSSTGPGADTVELQLLALNDFHGALEAPRGGVQLQNAAGELVSVPSGGVARLATLVKIRPPPFHYGWCRRPDWQQPFVVGNLSR